VDRRLIWFLALLAPVLAWSWVDPHDRFTWWLESAPVVIGVPAILARELLVRTSPLKASRWLRFLVLCVCLALSAFYEWFTAMTTGEAAEAFLGTQGDPWDTQTDMLMALVGAGAALLLLSGLHDRSMEKVLARR
jgi:putative membrane protein